MDEQAFIARIEKADADELAEILRRPSKEEDRVLRAYLGDERYKRMRDLTLRQSIRRAEARKPDGNVVVIHGIMGSELSAIATSGAIDHIWIKVLRIMAGALEHCRLDEAGVRELDDRYQVEPTGILKRHYGELLLALSANWRVRAFWFDWRKDLQTAARELDHRIRGWFDEGDPVHIVAHSMGGLVARTFIHDYAGTWNAMRSDDERGGRLVMLGTPNHGSFVIPQVIAGIESTAKKIARLDLRHTTRDLQAVFNSFLGLYQMLPSPLVADGKWKGLYHADAWGQSGVRQHFLDSAASHYKLLQDVIDPERMVYVAGANQPTLSGLAAPGRAAELDAYDVTLAGDGRVSHELGLLNGVPTYYVDEQHGDLSVNETILAELDELLRKGTCALPTAPPAARAASAENGRLLAVRLAEEEGRDENRVRELASALGARSVDPNGARPSYSGFKERELEELVVKGFLSSPTDGRRRGPDVPPRKPTMLRLALVHSGIEGVHDLVGTEPIDAIAVGHYVGVKPQEAELALDRSISAALRGKGGGLESAARGELLLTQYTERGTIGGELGQPFFLPDPRSDATAKTSERIIVVAGMGLPGRFGAPELTVLARELAWAVGRLGKRHLATVLIGTGTGNLQPRRAVDAMLRGVRDALIGASDETAAKLESLTFTEASARRIRPIQRAIQQAVAELAKSDPDFRLEYTEIPAAELNRLEEAGRERELEEFKLNLGRGDGQSRGRSAEQPTRLTLALEGGTYRFGAITENASLPERAIPLDPNLVDRANDELAGEWRAHLQPERGQLLERLLVPADLRPHLTGNSPVVMLLDSTTARIHWEMIAQSESLTPYSDRIDWDWSEAERRRILEPLFLGTRRGLTRQLRTAFAPPPEPPPPPRRVLRVLVIADPAPDAPLEGAEEEGVAVADLFESFNTLLATETESRISVVRLFGPNEATRTHVMRHLVCRSYDVLHFAGHCVYDENDPSRQGWLFNKQNMEVLSPNELNRVDRIPKFVFSNACESGVTPDRSGDRSADLAPSFAESFFSRGVSNFVCTAWPVNDAAAREFAVTLYSQLLGIDARGRPKKKDPWLPEPMHEAMREARLHTLGFPDGVQTWGAYQHYGNPYFRLFEQSETGRTARSKQRRPSQPRKQAVEGRRGG